MPVKYKNGVSAASTIFFHTPGNKIPDFFLYPLCIGHYFCNIPYEVNRTHFDSYLLLYTKSGKGLLTINGKSAELHAGDICLVNCYQPHAYRALEEWELLWLHFDGGIADSYFKYLVQDADYFHSTFKNPLSFEKNWHHIHELFINREPLSEPLLSQYIHQLLTELALTREDTGYKAAPDFIDDTLKYINRHLDSDLKLEKLSARESLSPFYFSRKFKEETGYSPYQYILLSRINLARFYLKSSTDSVKTIGLKCGFKSEHSFCTTFKTETGMTPSEFRRN